MFRNGSYVARNAHRRDPGTPAPNWPGSRTFGAGKGPSAGLSMGAWAVGGVGGLVARPPTACSCSRVKDTAVYTTLNVENMQSKFE